MRPSAPLVKQGDAVELKNVTKEQAVYPAARPLHGGDAYPCDGGKGHRPPSTYAPTISTILSRNYVVKEGRYLRRRISASS